MEGSLKIECAFCKCVPDEILETEPKCCGRLYCWGCVIDNRSCVCGSELKSENLVAVPELQAIVDRNKIAQCEYEGCGFSTTKQQLPEHQQSCQYRKVRCPHSVNCGLVPMNLLFDHIAVCPFVNVSCNHCAKSMPRNLLANHICSRPPKPQIHCPYLKYGCDYHHEEQEEINDHVNNSDSHHLQLIMNYSDAKEHEISQLKAQLQYYSSLSNVLQFSREVVSSNIIHAPLVERTAQCVNECTKQTLLRIIFVLFLATLLPMRIWFVKLLFVIFVMHKVWRYIFRPALHQVRYPNPQSPYYHYSLSKSIHQLIYLFLFSILTFITYKYTKYL